MRYDDFRRRLVGALLVEDGILTQDELQKIKDEIDKEVPEIFASEGLG